MTLSEALDVVQRELPKAGYPSMFVQLEAEERLPDGGWRLVYRLPFDGDKIVVTVNGSGALDSVRREHSSAAGG
jgi:hypothetical protein